MNYNGAGTLIHLVKEENQKRDLIKNQKLTEASEFYKDHPPQMKDDKRHDVDFKTKQEDNLNGDECDKKAQRKDPHLEGGDGKDMEKRHKNDADGKLPEPEDNKNWGNLDFYMKKYNISDKDDSGDNNLDSMKNIECGMYRK